MWLQNKLVHSIFRNGTYEYTRKTIIYYNNKETAVGFANSMNYYCDSHSQQIILIRYKIIYNAKTIARNVELRFYLNLFSLVPNKNITIRKLQRCIIVKCIIAVPTCILYTYMYFYAYIIIYTLGH